MTSELGNTLQSLSESIDAVTSAEAADALQVEIDQVWLQNEDDQRICSALDEMTARLLAWTDGVNERNAQLKEAAE